MRKIINSTYITLDGNIENPQNWPVGDNTKDNAGAIQLELLQACDAVVMGRRTYETFAAAWPDRSGDEFSDRINGMPKYVVSTTLQDPKWNNTTVISGDVVAEMKRLKDQPGGDVVQYGFGQLSFTLLEHGILDELRLWLYPLVLGSGGPEELMYRDSRLAQLRLIDVNPLPSGIVVLSYQARSAG